jgi:hypothetical protein
MQKRSVVDKVVRAISSPAAPLLTELPETPGLRLPEGKISTATRKQFNTEARSDPERKS